MADSAASSRHMAETIRKYQDAKRQTQNEYSALVGMGYAVPTGGMATNIGATNTWGDYRGIPGADEWMKNNVGARVAGTVADIAGDYVTYGATKVAEGIVDAAVSLAGWVGSWFGNDTKWAEDFVKFDASKWVTENIKQNIDVFDLGSKLISGYTLSNYSYLNDADEATKNGWRGTAEVVGELVPSVVAAIFTGGGSAAVQAAAAVGLAAANAASTMGQTVESDVNQGYDFNKSLGHGAIKGGISFGVSLVAGRIGGAAGKGVQKVAGKVGEKIGTKLGSKAAEVAASKATQILLKAGIDGTRQAAMVASDPLIKQITVDTDAIQKAYGSSEAVQNTLSNIGQAFAIGAVTSAASQAVLEGVEFKRRGNEGYMAKFYQDKADRLQKDLMSDVKKANAEIQKMSPAEAERFIKDKAVQWDGMSKRIVEAHNLTSEYLQNVSVGSINVDGTVAKTANSDTAVRRYNSARRQEIIDMFRNMGKTETSKGGQMISLGSASFSRTSANGGTYSDGETKADMTMVGNRLAIASKGSVTDITKSLQVYDNTPANGGIVVSAETPRIQTKDSGSQTFSLDTQRPLVITDAGIKNATDEGITPAQIASVLKKMDDPVAFFKDPKGSFKAIVRAEGEDTFDVVTVKPSEEMNAVTNVVAMSRGDMVRAYKENLPADFVSKPVQQDVEDTAEGRALIKQAAEGREGKVYTVKSSSDAVNSAIDYLEHELPSLADKGETLSLSRIGKSKAARVLFKNLNGKDADTAVAKVVEDVMSLRLTRTYKENGVDVSDSGTVSEILGHSLASDVRRELTDSLKAIVAAQGNPSRMSKAIEAYQKALRKAISAAKENKARINPTRRIQKEKISVKRKYKADSVNVESSQIHEHGAQMLFKPIAKAEFSNNGIGGRSVVEAFRELQAVYKPIGDPTLKGADGFDELYSDQLAAVIDYFASIQPDSHGRYASLTSEQANMLLAYSELARQVVEVKSRQFVDENAPASYSLVSEFRHSPALADHSASLGGKLATALNAMWQGGTRAVSMSFGYIQAVFGKDTEIGKLLTSEMLSATDRRDLAVTKWKEGFHSFLEKQGTDYKKMSKEANSEIVLKSRDGNEIGRMTLAEGVKLYNALHTTAYADDGSLTDSRNVFYAKHGGVWARTRKGNLRKVCDWSDDLPKAVEEAIGERGTALAKYVSDYYNGEGHQRYVEVCKAVDGGYVNTIQGIYDPIKAVTGKGGGGMVEVIDKFKPFNNMKDRTERPGEYGLLLTDPFEEVMEYVFNLENRAAVYPLVRKYHYVMNHSVGSKSMDTPRHVLEQSPEGAKALRFVDNYLQIASGLDPYGAKGSKSTVGRLVQFATNGWVYSKLGLNVFSSMPKQFASIFNTSEIEIKNVFRNMPVGLKNAFLPSKEFKAFVEKLGGSINALATRWESNPVLLGEAGDAVGKLAEIQAKFGSFTMKPLSWMDKKTIYMGIYCLAKQAEQYGYGKMFSDESLEYVIPQTLQFLAEQVNGNKLLMNSIRNGAYGPIMRAMMPMLGARQGIAYFVANSINQIRYYGSGPSAEEARAIADEAIEKAKVAKDASDKAEETFRKVSDDDNASASDVKEARKAAEEARQKWHEAEGDARAKDNYAKGKKAFEAKGGTKGHVKHMVGGMLAMATLVTMISQIASRIAGRKKWDEWDVGDVLVNIGVEATVNWIPVVNNVINAFKGYDMEMPTLTTINEMFDGFSAIATAFQNPTEGNIMTALRKSVMGFSSVMGIPLQNVWKYANGILGQFSPEGAIAMNSVLYAYSANRAHSEYSSAIKDGDSKRAVAYFKQIMREEKAGEVSDALAQKSVSLAIGGNYVMPSSVPSSYTNDKGELVQLTTAKQEAMRAVYSKANAMAARTASSAAFGKLSAKAQGRALKAVYDAYYEAGKAKAIKGYEPSTKMGELASSTSVDLGKLSAYVAHVKSIEATDKKSRKEQALEYLNKSPLSKQEKYLVLLLCGFSLGDDAQTATVRYLQSKGMARKEAKAFVGME